MQQKITFSGIVCYNSLIKDRESDIFMKVVIAIDSFKGSMTSLEAGESAAKGLRRVYPDAEIVVRPLADGGEGTVRALTKGCGGALTKICVTGPAGHPVECEYGILSDGRTAVIEMAGAAGITLVSGHEKNPLHTTTYGVGEVIRDAIQKGCRHFIIGIGGSATNDGGIGMLQALGFGLLDENDRQVCFGAAGLPHIKRITMENVLPQLKECTFRIACDVTNPLCGEKGCSAVFAPQKGAAPESIAQMDKWLKDFAGLTASNYPDADPSAEGAGAAGGLGFAFRTFLNASLEPGIRIVLEETGLSDSIWEANLVITGEGRMDAQTAMGKAPMGVAHLAKQWRKPVFAFCGCATPDATCCNEAGIDAFFPILRNEFSLEDAMNRETAMRNMADTVEQVFRGIRSYPAIFPAVPLVNRPVNTQ